MVRKNPLTIFKGIFRIQQQCSLIYDVLHWDPQCNEAHYCSALFNKIFWGFSTHQRNWGKKIVALISLPCSKFFPVFVTCFPSTSLTFHAILRVFNFQSQLPSLYQCVRINPNLNGRPIRVQDFELWIDFYALISRGKRTFKFKVFLVHYWTK